MIKNKTDLRYYLNQDRIQLRVKKGSWLKELIFPNKIYVFQMTLRKSEYYTNTAQKSIINKFLSLYYRVLLRNRSLKLGFTIPLNVFGPGLSIAHYGTIVVNKAARVGSNCRIHVCVNIGASGGGKDAPQIGDNVYIAPGCKIFGNISIADNVTISANSVVNKSMMTPNVIIGGVPAKVLKTYNDNELFNWKSESL